MQSANGLRASVRSSYVCQAGIRGPQACAKSPTLDMCNSSPSPYERNNVSHSAENFSNRDAPAAMPEMLMRGFLKCFPLSSQYRWMTAMNGSLEKAISTNSKAFCNHLFTQPFC